LFICSEKQAFDQPTNHVPVTRNDGFVSISTASSVSWRLFLEVFYGFLETNLYHWPPLRWVRGWRNQSSTNKHPRLLRSGTWLWRRGMGKEERLLLGRWEVWARLCLPSLPRTHCNVSKQPGTQPGHHTLMMIKTCLI